MYTRLHSDNLITTLERLSLRIRERFPKAGLANVCDELTGTARRAQKRAEEIGKPNLPLRWGVWIAVALVGVPLAYAATALKLGAGGRGLLDIAQGLEALVSLMVLVGGAILFLSTYEIRSKRRLVLEEIHQLRAVVHVIDMHQLTKDPGVVRACSTQTRHSPRREMTEFQLTRYLDYCSEMLTLASKVGVLYSQELNDVEIERNVNDLEQITTNMSHKIWQKIMILNRLIENRKAAAPEVPASGTHQFDARQPPAHSS